MNTEEKEQFARTLLNQFMELIPDAQKDFIDSMREICFEEDRENFDDWAIVIKEILFPETIGELRFGSMPTRKKK